MEPSTYPSKNPIEQSNTHALSVEQARKYLKREISNEQLQQKLGFLQGMVDIVIKQERLNYEQNIKNNITQEKA